MAGNVSFRAGMAGSQPSRAGEKGRDWKTGRPTLRVTNIKTRPVAHGVAKSNFEHIFYRELALVHVLEATNSSSQGCKMHAMAITPRLSRLILLERTIMQS